MRVSSFECSILDASVPTQSDSTASKVEVQGGHQMGLDVVQTIITHSVGSS